jgi:DNA-binding LacI/PurR family transcriptional regulator
MFMKKTSAKGRKRGYHQILGELRDQIISGKLGCSSRLPTRRELLKHYRTTPVTVNRALRLLAVHGFIVARGRSGTFVVAYPPHISDFAIAFPWARNHVPSQFYRAIQNEANKLQGQERHLQVFHGINEEGEEDGQRLLDLVETRRLAGVIFAHPPWRLANMPLIMDSGLPRVAIMQDGKNMNFPTVYPDVEGFLRKALTHLAGNGRRRVAVLMLGHDVPGKVEKTVMEEAQRQGVTILPRWIQGVGLESVAWTGQIMRALFEVDKSERPDGLVIMDDNLVEHASAGILASGVSVPEEVEVVALTNFPWLPPSDVPLKRLGYDITKLVALCMERIEQQRRGESFPQHTVLPALFDDEMNRVP